MIKLSVFSLALVTVSSFAGDISLKCNIPSLNKKAELSFNFSKSLLPHKASNVRLNNFDFVAALVNKTTINAEVIQEESILEVKEELVQTLSYNMLYNTIQLVYKFKDNNNDIHRFEYNFGPEKRSGTNLVPSIDQSYIIMLNDIVAMLPFNYTTYQVNGSSKTTENTYFHKSAQCQMESN